MKSEKKIATSLLIQETGNKSVNVEIKESRTEEIEDFSGKDDKC